MSYFVFPDTGRNEKNELTVHTRTKQLKRTELPIIINYFIITQ